MQQEEPKQFFEGEQRLQAPRPPLPPPTAEDIAELRALMGEMDGHLNEELMLNLRVQVERVIAWEDHHASE
jgi:hypothetical protein